MLAADFLLELAKGCLEMSATESQFIISCVMARLGSLMTYKKVIITEIIGVMVIGLKFVWHKKKSPKDGKGGLKRI